MIQARPIFDRLSALADPTRSRLLLLLDRHELTVGELCAALQLPQSTVSRHLKTLADEGWVSARAEGTSRRYAMPRSALDSSARGLWQLVRDQVGATPSARQDLGRAERVLQERRTTSQAFFSSTAGQWDRVRADLYGARTDLAPLIALLEPSLVVGDLASGTGHTTSALASRGLVFRRLRTGLRVCSRARVDPPATHGGRPRGCRAWRMATASRRARP